MNHPHFSEDHTDSVVGYLGLLKKALKQHYDGPAAVITVREDDEVTEVTVNEIPVLRVRSDRNGTVAVLVVQDWVPEFGRADRR